MQRGDNTFEAAVTVAASLVQYGVQELGDADLFLGDESIVSDDAEGSALDILLAALATVDGAEHGRPARLLARVLAHRDQVFGVVCVLTRWDQEREAVVNALINAGVETHIVVVRVGIDSGALSQPLSTLAPMSNVRVEHIAQDLCAAVTMPFEQDPQP